MISMSLDRGSHRVLDEFEHDMIKMRWDIHKGDFLCWRIVSRHSIDSPEIQLWSGHVVIFTNVPRGMIGLLDDGCDFAVQVDGSDHRTASVHGRRGGLL